MLKYIKENNLDKITAQTEKLLNRLSIMESERILNKFGTFGKWQISIFSIVLIFLKTFCAWRIFAIIYTGYRPPHHCKIPENSSLYQWLPVIDNETFSSCSMYDIQSSINSSVLVPSNQTTNCNNGWTFDLEESGPTVVSKWDLVCERAYLMQTSQTVLILGQGSALFATRVSDRFGRKLSLLIYATLMSLFGLLGAVVNRFEIYFVTKFFTGLFIGATLICKMVYLSESFSSKGRGFYVIVGSAYWGLAAALLPIPAYFIQNWAHLEIFISILCLITIPFLVWWLPETIPWLYANGRLQKAESVVKRIAKWNKINLTKQDLEKFSKPEMSNNSENMAFIDCDSKVNNQSSNLHIAKYSLTLLIRHRYLRRHMCLAFILLIANCCYYGVTYMSGSLSTNRFLSAFLNSIVEVPACIVAYLLCRRYGRKVPIIVFHFLSAVPIFLCIFTTAFEKEIPALSHVTLMLNVLFKLFISANFSITFFIGAELFPTNIRAQAVGICFLVGRIGGMLATYSSLIIELYPKTLYACFGFLMMLGGVITMILPETQNKPIPITIEDIEEWYQKKTPESLKTVNT